MLTFRAINDTPMSDSGISPTTLVYGLYPKIPGAGPRGSMAERANIIRECTKLVLRMKAKRIVNESKKIRNSPSMNEIEKVRTLPPGSEVLVYREELGWKKYPFVRTIGNSVDVVLPSRKISTFPINMSKPFYKPDENTSDTCDQTTQNIKFPSNLMIRSRLAKITSDGTKTSYGAVHKSKDYYRASRLDEISSLQELCCFEIVEKRESEGHRLYRPVFVDKVKSDGTKRSRLCAAACNDQEHGLFTATPTIKRISLRLLLSMSATYRLNLFTRDATKAFVNSKTKLRRPIYMQAPSEMNLEAGKVLKVVKQLYGMPESPMHWFKTYLDYHRTSLSMQQTPLDPCLLFARNEEVVSGLLGLQVDDTLFAGNLEFLKAEEEASNTFPNTGRTKVLGIKTKFNGVDIQQSSEEITMDQQSYITNIPDVSTKEALSFEDFRSIRAKIAYASFSTAPDSLVFVAHLAQYTESRYNSDELNPMRILRKLLKIMKGYPSLGGLRFVHIPPQSLEVVVCIDAAFAVNKDNSSQLGVVAMLLNKNTFESNIIHFLSIKSKRVCKSVLSAELFSLVDGFDIGYSIRDSCSRITGRKDIELTISTDSKTLYGLSITLSQTTERRLQIDLALIQEAYERCDIHHLVWLPSSDNPADDLTKIEKRSGSLQKLISTNYFKPEISTWVQRDLTPVQT